MLNIATRTESGTKNPNYILSIYKNEGGKSTIVRKYDSSREDMQKPEYIWLLEGNYTAVVESGTIVNASFDATEYYFGEANFDIKAGTTSTVDIVAVMQNIPVEVLFDQTIIDGFLDGFYVKVSANSDIELTYKKSQTGYFIMPEGTKTLSWNFVGTFE